jgi:hypothetical protein
VTRGRSPWAGATVSWVLLPEDVGIVRMAGGMGTSQAMEAAAVLPEVRRERESTVLPNERLLVWYVLIPDAFVESDKTVGLALGVGDGGVGFLLSIDGTGEVVAAKLFAGAGSGFVGIESTWERDEVLSDRSGVLSVSWDLLLLYFSVKQRISQPTRYDMVECLRTEISESKHKEKRERCNCLSSVFMPGTVPDLSAGIDRRIPKGLEWGFRVSTLR